MASNPSNGRLAISSKLGGVQIWDIAARRKITNLKSGELMQSVTISAGGAYIAAGGEHGNARIWNISTGQQLRELRHYVAVNDMTFGPNGFLATACADGIVRIWYGPDADVLREFNHTGRAVTQAPYEDQFHSVRSVAFASNGLLATGSADKTARVSSRKSAS